MADGNKISANLSTLKITIDGDDIPTTYHVTGVMVTKKYNKISSASITLADGDAAKRDFPISNEERFKPGNNIEILAGYHSEDKTIFKGLIIEHGIKSKGSRTSQLIIHCKDKAILLNRGCQNVIYKDSTDSEVIKEILDFHQLENVVEPTETRHGALVKYNTTSWDFIVSRAEKNGLLVYTDDGKISLLPPDVEQSPIVDLVYGDNIFDIDLNMDSRNQVNTVSGTSWDFSNQQLIIEDADKSGYAEPGNISGEDMGKFISPENINLNHCGFLPDQELRSWANARLHKSRLSKIIGKVRTQGDDKIKPGTKVSLTGVGERFNGNHFVSAVHHSITQGDWETELQLGLSPHWFTEINNVNDQKASGLLPAVNGLLIGVVTQLEDDPIGEDRIQVKLPVLDAEDEGVWARVVSLDAGSNRGAFFRPDIGDEVILGFLNDDPRHPLVLGMLNSSAKPAPLIATDDNHEKGFVTRSDMRIMFNDEKKMLSLSTPSNKVILLDEDSGVITVSDEHGNKLEMNSDGISMMSRGDIHISAEKDLSLQGININSEASSLLTLKGESSVEISSSGNTAVKGALVKLN